MCVCMCVWVGNTAVLPPKAQTLVDTGEADVEVVGAKPGMPYLSAKSFEDLNLPADILKGVYAKGFTKPSKIQEVAMPLIVRYARELLLLLPLAFLASCGRVIFRIRASSCE